MKKHEYIKPCIKGIIRLPYLMQSLSVIDPDQPIDDENEILSADDPLNPVWGMRQKSNGFDE
ncbi:MAG: hypothetical protein IJK87_07105 [Prevotella sp.]|nr:hypothetical protein [Prevotella sp.]